MAARTTRASLITSMNRRGTVGTMSISLRTSATPRASTSTARGMASRAFIPNLTTRLITDPQDLSSRVPSPCAHPRASEWTLIQAAPIYRARSPGASAAHEYSRPPRAPGISGWNSSRRGVTFRVRRMPRFVPRSRRTPAGRPARLRPLRRRHRRAHDVPAQDGRRARRGARHTAGRGRHERPGGDNRTSAIRPRIRPSAGSGAQSPCQKVAPATPAPKRANPA